jgi:subtilisin family serine protease
VAASGNYNQDTDATPFYPASYTRVIPGLISVGASTWYAGRADFSSYGRWGNSLQFLSSLPLQVAPAPKGNVPAPAAYHRISPGSMPSIFCRKSVDLFAVGKDVRTTSADTFDDPGDYTTVEGTSFAGPMVAGAAVLMASATRNKLTGAELKAMIMKTVDVIPELDGLCVTGVRELVGGGCSWHALAQQAAAMADVAWCGSHGSCSHTGCWGYCFFCIASSPP